MKRIYLFSLLVAALLPASGAAAVRGGAGVVDLRVMSCNIRVTGLEADDMPLRRWDDRKEYMVDCILDRRPDIVCMQEVVYDSYAYCRDRMKGYTAVGFEGPEMDPYTEGYHLIAKNVIFFDRRRFELVSSGCYWLSETPHIGGSMSWGTARARHCTWVRLRERRSGGEFRVLDVHLDHISDEAKLAQIGMVIEESAQYPASMPQIMCGDMNSVRQSPPMQALRASAWSDVFETLNGRIEAGYTAHAWKGESRPMKPGKGRIDYIFVTGGVEAADFNIHKDCKDGMYASDHFFISADLGLKCNER